MKHSRFDGLLRLMMIGAMMLGAACADSGSVASPDGGAPWSGADGDTDGDADTDGDTDADADGDTDADADGDTDTDADTATGSGGGSDTETETETETDRGTGGTDGDTDADTDTDTDGDTDADTDGDTDTDTDTDADIDTETDSGTGIPADGGDPDDAGPGGDAGDTDVCESVAVQAEVDPVYLVFAFDVSGSMGQGDLPWHDQSLKWDPISQATRAFLEDPASEGYFASMTFFPQGGRDDWCVDKSYVDPDVPMTALPSETFGVAMDAILEDEWAGWTPTVHVMNGIIEYILESREDAPGEYTIVLVTDGYPQGCTNTGNDLPGVVAAAQLGVAVAVDTYVIGVNNPPIEGAPDTVSNLGEIAAAGNTESAFIIDTGDPDQTALDFAAAIEAIRGATFACTVAIPPPPDDREFDKQKVRVTYSSDGGETELVYDPTCAESNAWRYDDPEQPTQIVLCEETCGALQNDRSGALEVEFSCVDTIIIII